MALQEQGDLVAHLDVGAVEKGLGLEGGTLPGSQGAIQDLDAVELEEALSKALLQVGPEGAGEACLAVDDAIDHHPQAAWEVRPKGV